MHLVKFCSFLAFSYFLLFCYNVYGEFTEIQIYVQ